MTTINPRSLGNEAPFVSLDVIALADVKAELIAMGSSPAEASGVVGWLIDKAAGNPDITSAPTRSRYRKLLAELDQPEPRPRPRRGRSDAGNVTYLPSALVGAGAAAGVLALAPTSPVGVVLALVATLAPIMPDTDVMEPCEVAA